MSQSESLDHEDKAPVAAYPNTARKIAGDRPIRLNFDRIIAHARLQPILSKMFPDQRRYKRLFLPNIVGYLGKAHASRPHQIANISAGGFCMISDEYWTRGTEMPITLQREDWDGDESCERVTVQAIVARSGPRETGFSIALSSIESIAFSESAYEGLWITPAGMEQFLEALQKSKPARISPVFQNVEVPLTLAERTQRLIEIAKSHSISKASELLNARR